MNTSTTKKTIGLAAEDMVANYLTQRGFKILAHNYQKKYGEIDLIAQAAGILVFVEVKMRHSPLFDLTEVINQSKQRKIVKVAKQFVVEHKIEDTIIRFDVALVTGNGHNAQIDYIPHAFTDEE